MFCLLFAWVHCFLIIELYEFFVNSGYMLYRIYVLQIFPPSLSVYFLSYRYFFVFVFWLCHAVHKILVFKPGMESVLPAAEAWSANHWNAREIRLYLFLMLPFEVQKFWFLKRSILSIFFPHLRTMFLVLHIGNLLPRSKSKDFLCSKSLLVFSLTFKCMT